MATHEITLLGREEIAAGTMQFRFSRPAGFVFRAGQSADFALDSEHRIFSIASAPYELELAVATRMRDGSTFKQALRAAPLGTTTMTLKGPRGVMTLHDDRARAAVFLAGGIGITPFISMLRQARVERVTRPLFLLYSNRNAESAAFLSELQAIEADLRSFRMLARMTDTEGILDAAAIRRFLKHALHPMYYLAGPPGMVEAFSTILTEFGVREHDIQTEEFYGY